MNTPAFTLALVGGRLVYNPGHAVARLPGWLLWLQGAWSQI